MIDVTEFFDGSAASVKYARIASVNRAEAKNISPKEFMDLYKIYRDYIQFEAGLVNNRISWIMTINGFLFASFGVLLNVMFVNKTDTFIVPMSEFMSLIVGFSGLAVNWHGTWLIKFAQQANVGVETAFLRLVADAKYQFDNNLNDKYNKKYVYATMFPSDARRPNQMNIQHSEEFEIYTYPGMFTLPGLRGGGSDASVRISYVVSREEF